MAASIMGIEIGSSNIKIIETTRKAATLVVERFSLLDTPKDCVNNGVITNVGPIHKVIQTELNNQKYKAKKVVAIVQSNSILIRNVVMDKYPEKVIGELLQNHTEDYLPIERGQYQIDFKVVKEVEEEGKAKNSVLLVAAPNGVVLPIAALIKNLKRVPVSISIPSEAMGNVFGVDRRMIYDATLGDLLVVDIGGHSSTATIISDNHAVLTRTLDFGVENINEAVEETMQARHLEKESEEYEEMINDIIRPIVEYNVTSELERIIQFYYTNYGNSVIKKVYLVGGGANIKGIRNYIRDALNMPTEKLNEFSTVVEAPGIEFEPYRRFFVNILGAINGL